MKDENHFVTAYIIRSTDALIYRTTLEYDRRSRLKRIEFDGEALEYVYDSLGRLVSRKIGTVEMQCEYLSGDETHYGAGFSHIVRW